MDQVREISFNASAATQQGQEVLYITERAVFRLDRGGLTMTEVAEGLDPESDVIAHMGFRPPVAEDLKTMDPAVFASGTMGLRDRLVEEPRW